MTSRLQSSANAFAYGDRPALHGIDLALAAGELVALLGPNGSGKSTLIKCLLGHLPATGAINWDGKPITSWTRRQLARRVAYLPQSPVAETGQTVLDVLRLGRSPYWSAFGLESPRDEEVVRAVSARLGLDDLLARPMEELSGGQRQRVFVGRCLVQEPAAMLLDEPSTFLDLRHQVELCQLLKQLSKEQSMGVLMASHDLNLAAAYADRVMVLSEGAVAASGGVSVLEPEMLSRVYGVEMVRLEGPGGAPVLLARPA
jgi:iron complex transport system ATP-binding protein